MKSLKGMFVRVVACSLDFERMQSLHKTPDCRATLCYYIIPSLVNRAMVYRDYFYIKSTPSPSNK